jgi:hypothetical protein
VFQFLGTAASLRKSRVSQNHIYVYGVRTVLFCREITQYTVIYGVHIYGSGQHYVKAEAMFVVTQTGLLAKSEQLIENIEIKKSQE